ncbi:hypothetical protein [uncultured Acetobacteroides sp.]|uniref:hypothetical protein n=1 Tax=uncultured Acetobacteroides sp. TaxID=1760811 RepID=UPI0029F5CA65|nr:hypothetical protein [uncultured Acetobacteroides sp.]
MELYKAIYGDSWKENIVLSSVPLWKYDKQIPIANASGCLINYKNNVFLVSIAHASIAESEWNVEVKAVEKVGDHFGTILQPIKMQPLAEFKITPNGTGFTEPKIVDFTYRKVSDTFKSTHCLGIINQNQLMESDRTVFSTNFQDIPSEEKKYGFYGKVKFNGVKGKLMDFQHRIESDLEYIGKKDEFYVFRLSHKYGSHANYVGCSGAPIIDQDNKVVALVSYGVKSENCIYAIDIAKYRAALDIELL